MYHSRKVHVRSGVEAVFRGVLESGGGLKGAAPSRREEVTTVVSLGTGRGDGEVKYVTSNLI